MSYEIGRWLDRIREDQDAPGFWEAFKSATLGSVPTLEGSDDTFEEHEVRLLSRALDDVAYAFEKEEAPGAIAEIRAEIDALKADLATLKKGRWMRLAQGAFVNLLVRQLVPRSYSARRGKWLCTHYSRSQHCRCHHLDRVRSNVLGLTCASQDGDREA